MEGGGEGGAKGAGGVGSGPPPMSNPLMAILNRFRERGEAKKNEVQTRK